MKTTMFTVMGVAESLLAVIAQAVETVFAKEIEPERDLPLGNPPKPEMGDVTVPCFLLAKVLQQAPAKIAAQLAKVIQPQGNIQTVSAVGPYLNFSLAPGAVIQTVVGQILLAGEFYGTSQVGGGQRVMVEYSGPNSNKAMHLGHLRNNQLGIALCKILAAVGHQVIPVNIVNDRGIAICRSMVAYRHWGQGQTPKRAGVKGDHFVGELYARFMEEVEAELSAWLTTKDMTLEAYKALPEAEQKPITKEFEAQSALTREAFET
ncbi:MAG: arginine--tRNA ligase, partial [Candidatus Buchananbacteria bacterium]